MYIVQCTYIFIHGPILYMQGVSTKTFRVRYFHIGKLFVMLIICDVKKSQKMDKKGTTLISLYFFFIHLSLETHLYFSLRHTI